MEVTHAEPAPGGSGGGKIAERVARFDKSVLATYSRPSIIFTHGKGLQLFAATDSDGHREYLDFSSGIAVNSLGHSDEQIADIAGEQARKLVHSSNLYHNEWSGELANKMVELTWLHGGLGMEKGAKGEAQTLKVFLANSGTEANEGE